MKSAIDRKNLIILLMISAEFLSILPCVSPTSPTFPKPLALNLSISKAPALWETAELTVNFSYTHGIVKGLEEALINVSLPEGFELVSGNLTWKGSMEENSSCCFQAVIKAIKGGEWTISGEYFMPRPDMDMGRVRTTDSLYLSVFDDKGILHEEKSQSQKTDDGHHLSLVSLIRHLPFITIALYVNIIIFSIYFFLVPGKTKPGKRGN